MNRFILSLAAAVPLLAASLAFGEITGSKHDFSAATWSDQEICKPCHTPHNAEVSITGRIWAHTMSTATYTYHGSSSLSEDGTTRQDAANVTIDQTRMDGASRLCLSCHDGTVALDSFKGKVGGSTGKSIGDLASADGLYNPNIGGAAVGAATADLSNDHPVGFNARYDELSGGVGKYRYKPVANVLASLRLAKSPDLYPTNADGSPREGRDGDPYPEGMTYYSVSCVSCHDVHNAGAPEERGLLRISNQGSTMCLTCHVK